MNDRIDKYHLCDYWDSAPTFVIKITNGIIIDQFPHGVQECYKDLSDRWVNKDINVLIRFCAIRKPRIYIFPELWIRDIMVQKK